jgi:hypothetical protein
MREELVKSLEVENQINQLSQQDIEIVRRSQHIDMNLARTKAEYKKGLQLTQNLQKHILSLESGIKEQGQIREQNDSQMQAAEEKAKQVADQVKNGSEQASFS